MTGLARVREQEARPLWLPGLITVIGLAWALAAAAQLTGNAAMLHHDALIEGGPPLWLGVPVFLVGWLVMVVAMMLPASLPTVRAFAGSLAALDRERGLSHFLGAYAVAWSVFGLVAFAGDDVLHHVVDATPWLAANPWIVNAGVLATAGAYQFTPCKRRSLDACRSPHVADADVSAVRQGLEHARDCLGSSAALMLVMFGAGFANLWWMAALGALMTYETTGRHGHRAASAVGLRLIWLAVL